MTGDSCVVQRRNQRGPGDALALLGELSADLELEAQSRGRTARGSGRSATPGSRGPALPRTRLSSSTSSSACRRPRSSSGRRLVIALPLIAVTGRGVTDEQDHERRSRWFSARPRPSGPGARGASRNAEARVGPCVADGSSARRGGPLRRRTRCSSPVQDATDPFGRNNGVLVRSHDILELLRRLDEAARPLAGHGLRQLGCIACALGQDPRAVDLFGARLRSQLARRATKLLELLCGYLLQREVRPAAPAVPQRPRSVGRATSGSARRTALCAPASRPAGARSRGAWITGSSSGPAFLPRLASRTSKSRAAASSPPIQRNSARRALSQVSSKSARVTLEDATHAADGHSEVVDVRPDRRPTG